MDLSQIRKQVGSKDIRWLEENRREGFFFPGTSSLEEWEFILSWSTYFLWQTEKMDLLSLQRAEDRRWMLNLIKSRSVLCRRERKGGRRKTLSFGVHPSPLEANQPPHLSSVNIVQRTSWTEYKVYQLDVFSEWWWCSMLILLHVLFRKLTMWLSTWTMEYRVKYGSVSATKSLPDSFSILKQAALVETHSPLRSTLAMFISRWSCPAPS